MRPVLKEFMSRIYQEKIDQFRAIRVQQDGKLWGEVFHAPRVPYNIHSTSKSFTSTAVGIAIDEGILSLEDKVVDAFPEHLPEKISDRLGGLTLRHLLKMSSGHEHMTSADPNRLIEYTNYSDDSWLRQYLSRDIIYEPGTQFWYESGDTYTAGAMLQKKVGMTTVEYLKSRLFDPLQIETPYWHTSPEGYNIGYTGLWLKTEDLIKLAELYRNKGDWFGRQIFSAEWAAEATSYLIATGNDDTKAGQKASGYGYQIWVMKDGFCGSGLGGQYSIAIPKYNACIAFSAYDIPKQSIVLDIILENIVPHLA